MNHTHLVLWQHWNKFQHLLPRLKMNTRETQVVKNIADFVQQGQILGYRSDKLCEYVNKTHTEHIAKNLSKIAKTNAVHTQQSENSQRIKHSAAVVSEFKQKTKGKHSGITKCPYCSYEHKTSTMCDKDPAYSSRVLDIVNNGRSNKPKPLALKLCYFCRTIGHLKRSCIALKMKKEKKNGIQTEQEKPKANESANENICELMKPPQIGCALCDWRRKTGHETYPHVAVIGSTCMHCPGTIKKDNEIVVNRENRVIKNRIVFNNKDTSTSNSATESHDTVPTATTSKGKSKGKTKTISPSKSTTPTSIKENPDSPQTVRTVIPQTNATTSTSLTKVTAGEVTSDLKRSTEVASKVFSCAAGTEAKSKLADTKMKSGKKGKHGKSTVMEKASKPKCRPVQDTSPSDELYYMSIFDTSSDEETEHIRCMWFYDGITIPTEIMFDTLNLENRSAPMIAFVNNIRCELEINTKTPLSIVRDTLVGESDYTGETVYSHTTDGRKIGYRLAYIDLESAVLSKRIMVMTIKHLDGDIIL